MKVVLLHDVKGIGKMRDVKDVSDGYALNLLIPKGLAQVATADVLKRVELEKKREADEHKINEDLLSKNLHSIHGITIEVERKASDKGHLFDGLDAKEIIELVKEKTKVEIPPHSLVLAKAIKTTGEHAIDIKAHGKQASFILKVVGK